VAAKIYRDLVYAGTKALRANGHRSDQILLGETAPVGQGTIRTSPAVFYQTLFCVNSKGKKVLGTQAEWINEFEYLAYKNRKVKAVTQFQLEDDTALKTKAFQTGLRFSDGRNKPAYGAYLVPLFVHNKGAKF